MYFMTPKSASLPRVGGIATMPSRADTFAVVLAKILPQVEWLYVFFDKYPAIPDIANHPKIVPLHASHANDIAGDGKFLGAELHAEPCLYFCFDDDIDYPANYVEVLTRALYRQNLAAVVGLHAISFIPPHRSYMRDPSCGPSFQRGRAGRIPAPTLSVPGRWPSAPTDFAFLRGNGAYHDMADLFVSIEAVGNNSCREFPFRRQTANFLRPLQEESNGQPVPTASGGRFSAA